MGCANQRADILKASAMSWQGVSRSVSHGPDDAAAMLNNAKLFIEFTSRSVADYLSSLLRYRQMPCANIASWVSK